MTFIVWTWTGNLERLTNGNGIASDLKVFADGKTAVFLKWHKNWRWKAGH